MRILIIGGTGKIGSGAARCLARAESVSKIILTDIISSERARQVADEIGPKAEGVRLNVEDIGRMQELMRTVDMVLNW